ncbi:hypothetical protein QFZ27_004170 [Inquilinus ginsengisoli]|uniref:zinc ribbon domain-containing protein n=1 Tax=Inquilinus ginsengisoli TaxID=363840 RepID=UPI003D1AB9DB
MIVFEDWTFSEWFFVLSFAVTTAIVAHVRGRNAVGWFILGLLFNVFSLIILFALNRLPRGPVKTCPRCAETVLAAALVCRHCGHEFALHRPSPARPSRPLPVVIGAPRTFVSRDSYGSVAYSVFSDGSIEATLDGALRAWDNVDEFRRDADRRTLSISGGRRGGV